VCDAPGTWCISIGALVAVAEDIAAQIRVKESDMSWDHFAEERQRLERVLSILEAVAGRLEAGGALPLQLLEDACEFLRASEEEGYEASQSSDGQPPLSFCVEQHIAARIPIRGMQQALSGLEWGEASAGDRFARYAREYVGLRRAHLRRDDRLIRRARADETAGGAADRTPESPAAQRIYGRLLEGAASLTLG
jgi:hemerythrin-like domain-containing protein